MGDTSTRSGATHGSSAIGGLASFTTKYPFFTRVALVITWLIGPYFAAHAIVFAVLNRNPGFDAHAYWLTGQGSLVYSRAAGQTDAFLYSPAFAFAIRPLTVLDWPFFLATWIVIEAVLLVWLLKPLQLKWSIPLFLLCVPELVNANIFILLAACAVLGIRRPGFWAFPLLTKITSGVGLVWFAVRGDWRRVLQAIGFTVTIVAVSYLLTPSDWHSWMNFLVTHSDGTQDGPFSFVLRCLVAVSVVAWGAKKNWPWLIGPAMVIASPVFALPTLTLLAAIPRLASAGSNEAKQQD